MKKDRARKFKPVNLSPKFWVMVLIAAIFIFLVVWAGAMVYRSPLFTIKEVESNIAGDRDLKLKIKGASLFTLDTKRIHEHIIEEYPEYEKVVIFKKLPSSLVIEVKKKIPFAQWKGRKFFPLDKEGIIIGKGEDNALAGLVSVEITDYKQPVRKGARINDRRLEYAFRLIEDLGRRDIFDEFSIELVNPTRPRAFYFVINDIKVLMGSEDIKRKVDLLEELLKGNLHDKLPSLKYIDLRHKKVYLGFKR